MFSIHQSIKEHIAWNEGYSAGQQDAHRFYHMMFTKQQETPQAGGNVNDLQARLGKHQDDGYTLEYYATDHTVVIGFKGDQVAALPDITATPDRIDAIIQRHQARLGTPVGVPHG